MLFSCLILAPGVLLLGGYDTQQSAMTPAWRAPLTLREGRSGKRRLSVDIFFFKYRKTVAPLPQMFSLLKAPHCVGKYEEAPSGTQIIVGILVTIGTWIFMAVFTVQILTVILVICYGNLEDVPNTIKPAARILLWSFLLVELVIASVTGILTSRPIFERMPVWLQLPPVCPLSWYIDLSASGGNERFIVTHVETCLCSLVASRTSSFTSSRFFRLKTTPL